MGTLAATIGEELNSATAGLGYLFGSRIGLTTQLSPWNLTCDCNIMQNLGILNDKHFDIVPLGL
jgi:hypothetical protein